VTSRAREEAAERDALALTPVEAGLALREALLDGAERPAVIGLELL